nr:hypothetical protein [Tanacetum cinerariifolium]
MEVNELIEFYAVALRYVTVEDLYQEPFLYSVIGDLLDQVLETDPGALDGFVDTLFESEDPAPSGSPKPSRFSFRLYCRGKENRVNILKSIDEGPFQMGNVRDPLAEGTEGAPFSDIYTLINHYTDAKDIWDNVKMLLEGSKLTKKIGNHNCLTPTDNLIENLTNTLALLTQSYKIFLPQTNNQLRTSSNTRNQATVQDGRVVVQNVQGRQNRGQGTNPQGGGAVRYRGVQNRVGNANPGQARQVKCYNRNGIGIISRNCTQPKRPQNSDYYKDKMLLMQAQENRDLALNVDNVFQADDCDAFDSDVDEASTAQPMFMANMSSANLVNDEVGPSYDSDILSEVHDHDYYQDVVCKHHEEHAMHDNVQLNHVVGSHADYTSDSNMIPYDQYVEDNAVPVVHSNVSSIPNDAYMMIYNDMYEPHAQSISKTSRNTVVENSLTAKLATYKEQVELYKRQAMFKLTKREQKINEQLRLVISGRNFKEETLKKELHSVKLQLASAINHNKLMVEEVTSMKKDFKQKENKYLEDFLDMKSLKEKVEDSLFKQDQSLQTDHMLYRPKPYYNELNKVAIGYKNPLCLTRAKHVQPALYNGHEIIKDNYVPAIVHNTKDTLEIAEITRRKMNDKMKDPECGERGFEQTKECYLKEVIPFFKTIKEHFEGIQKALSKEIKEMKDVFEELEAE